MSGFLNRSSRYFSANSVGSTGDEHPDFDKGLRLSGVSRDAARVALAAVDTGGGVFAWQNPHAETVIIDKIVIHVTTASTGACTVDVGTTATSAATSSDNLIDGLDVNTAAGVFDNVTDKGTNGKTRQTVATGKWITASKASGASAGIVGYAYIYYTRVL